MAGVIVRATEELKDLAKGNSDGYPVSTVHSHSVVTNTHTDGVVQLMAYCGHQASKTPIFSIVSYLDFFTVEKHNREHFLLSSLMPWRAAMGFSQDI